MPTKTYDDCSLADANAAEQFAVAYVAQVGVSKETMIDAISTLRAQLLTAWRERVRLGTDCDLDPEDEIDACHHGVGFDEECEECEEEDRDGGAK